MNETDVIAALDQACEGLNLIFQVVHDAETFYIYANRLDAEPSFSYETLTHKVQAAIAAYQESAVYEGFAPAQCPSFQTLHLYSRELGTIEPDWQVTLALSFAQADRLEASPEAVLAVMPPDVLESENLQIESDLSRLDLSDYCFTRNQALLTSEILPPTEQIARLVQRFHGLSLQNKRNALPNVEHFFRTNSLAVIDDLNVETQAWLHQLAQIDTASLRKAAIWMSRYCFSPETAITQVTAILPSEEVTAAAAASEAAAPLSLVQRMLATPTESSLAQYSTVTSARARAVHKPAHKPPATLAQPVAPQPPPSEVQTKPRLGWWQALFGTGTAHRSDRHP